MQAILAFSKNRMLSQYANLAYYATAANIGPVQTLTAHRRRQEALRQHLRTLRRLAGLTQLELGLRLKVDQSHVSKIERGERHVDVLFYLDWCRACRLAPEAALLQLIQAGG